MTKKRSNPRFHKADNFLRRFYIPSRLIFIITGILATGWFLFRVIQKPSRVTYPCMKATAPWASAFILYLLSLSGSILSIRKIKGHLLKARYAMSAAILIIGLALGFIALSTNPGITNASEVNTNAFIPNNPIGNAKGIFPGRVVWVWNPGVTNENMTNTTGDYWFEDKNVNDTVMKKMLEDGLKQLTGELTVVGAWDAIFRHFNKEQGKGDVGYTAGEKVMVKINLTNSCCEMTGKTKTGNFERMDATPQLCLLILEQLIDVAGIEQANITFGDTYRTFRDDYWDKCHSVYPDVNYCDGSGGDGRVKSQGTAEQLIRFSNGEVTSSVPVSYHEAAYLINVPCLKTHDIGGITISAKNHQGSVLEEGTLPEYQSAAYLHPYFPKNDPGNGKYRHLVDYMGHEDLGGKTLLHLVDGIWGGHNWEGQIRKFDMAPFNTDFPSSLIISLDPVAIESVCFDIFLEEYKDKADEKYPYMEGVEDYLLQAADTTYWPAGIKYDPEGDGSNLKSLGVYEHWNNATDRQYSGNLGTGNGIELITLFPGDSIIIPVDTNTTTVDNNFTSENSGLLSNRVNAVFIDSFNVKWFGTDKGISRYTDESWDSVSSATSHLRNDHVNDIAYEKTDFGDELWIGTDGGLSVLAYDVDGVTGATTYYRGGPGSRILNDTVLAVGVDIRNNRWIGTPDGLSIFKGSSWDSIKTYKDGNDKTRSFDEVTITGIASYDKDSLAYISTNGAGVLRFSNDEVDGVTGASTLDKLWTSFGTNNIHALDIKDTTQWYGADDGAYKHLGPYTKSWWFEFDINDGLVSNTIISAYIDNEDNIWLGTDQGLSIFTQQGWYEYTADLGLINPVVNDISEDMDGNIWIGTNGGVQWFSEIPGIKSSLDSPILESPANDSTGVAQPVNLTWLSVEGAKSYTLQVAKSSGFTSPLINETGIVSLSYIITGLDGNTIYYWRVAASGDSKSGPWSATYKFTTEIISLVHDIDNSLSDIHIYPNPATDHLNISVDGLSAAQVIFSIYDIKGSEIYKEAVTVSDESLRASFDLNSMNIRKGIYFVNIIADGEQITKRLLVK